MQWGRKRALGMLRVRDFVAIGAIAAAGLLGTGVLSAGAENGNGFNCTHGDVASAGHDNGNGHDCLQAATVTTTPTTTTTVTSSVSSAVASTSAAKAATAVAAQPKLTG